MHPRNELEHWKLKLDAAYKRGTGFSDHPLVALPTNRSGTTRVVGAMTFPMSSAVPRACVLYRSQDVHRLLYDVSRFLAGILVSIVV